MKRKMNVPPAKRVITALGFDVGLLCTACVQVKGNKTVSFYLLTRENTKKTKYETIQDEMLDWLNGPDLCPLYGDIDKVGIEMHWSGPRPSGVQIKLRVLEMTIRQFFIQKGIPVDTVWAATYKKKLGVCRLSHKENKKLASKIALKHVIKDNKDKTLLERTHDLGDAYLVALYETEGILEGVEDKKEGK